MRAAASATWALLVGALACAEPPSELAAQADAGAQPASAPAVPGNQAPSSPQPASPGEVEAAMAQIEATPSDEPATLEADTEATPLEEPGPPAEPSDPLAPILPEGPEPGSPEADAELEALLDESTLTQDEFDRAFRKGGGPNVDGDRLVFGPNDRTRERPVVTVSAVTGEAKTADVRALAKATTAKLEACYLMALSKQPDTAGSATLILRYGSAGEVEDVSVAAGSPLGASLDRCLASVAEEWTLKTASGEVRVTLKLSADAG